MGAYKYRIGVSFTGTHRAYVEQVCKDLVKLGFDRDEVFYDNWHQTRITVPNADVLMSSIYRNECQAVVVFLSEDYADKPWTGNIEWRAIRDLINTARSGHICLLRLDNIDIDTIDGLSSTRDIATSVKEWISSETAQFIRDWYEEHVGGNSKKPSAVS